jgi:hypothetical protein
MHAVCLRGLAFGLLVSAGNLSYIQHRSLEMSWHLFSRLVKLLVGMAFGMSLLWI